jgi:Endosomal/lysosomal potassium channel TMEM175
MARDSQIMAEVAPERSGGATIRRTSPPENVRLSDTDRLETFSDSIFAITITLLVFDIVRPDYVY